MLKTSRMMLFAIGILLSAAGVADDEKPLGTDSEPLPSATLSAEELLEKLNYASRRQPSPTSEAMTYSDDWPRPSSNLNSDFSFSVRDTSALERVSKLRSFSLLTLGQFERSRLFLGVNNDGLVGLHFGSYLRHSDRYAEVIRMPYLE